jgi:PST family polysaccharide transporter
MSQSKQLVKNIASLGIVQIVNYIFPLLTIPYVSRILGPSGLGSINYITAFVAYFTLVVGYGFDLTATRKIAANSESKKNRSLVFSQVMNARFTLFGISTLIFIICIISVNNFKSHLVLCLIIYINTISVFLSPQYLFQGLQQLSLYSFVNLVRGVISTILIFLLIKNPEDYIIYAGIGVLLNFICTLYFLIYAVLKFQLKFYFINIRSSIRLLIKERFIFFSSVVFSLYTSTNILILGFYETPEKVGYYTVALSLIGIIQSVINIPLSTSLYPFVGSTFSKSIDLGVEQLRKILPIIFYITFCGAVVLFIAAPLVIKIIYGNKFINSIPCIMILSILPLISSISSLLGVQTMLNLKMDKEFLRITSYGAALSLVLNLTLGYFFSYIGTTISYLLTELFIIILLFAKLRSKNINLVNFEYFKPKVLFSIVMNLKKQI